MLSLSLALFDYTNPLKFSSQIYKVGCIVLLLFLKYCFQVRHGTGHTYTNPPTFHYVSIGT